MKKWLLFFVMILSAAQLLAEDGYDLWLRYVKITNSNLLTQYKKQIISPAVFGSSATCNVIKEELSKA